MSYAAQARQPVTSQPEDQESDPLAAAVECALNVGWSLVLQVDYGVCENALIRTVEWFTDLVTLPPAGFSTVVRLQGGPARKQPRRTGHEWWRHHVPPEVALQWLLTNPDDDQLLIQWQRDPGEASANR